MDVLYLILYLLAAVCFVVASVAWWRPPAQVVPRWGGLVALGLFFWVLVPLIQHARAM